MAWSNPRFVCSSRHHHRTSHSHKYCFLSFLSGLHPLLFPFPFFHLSTFTTTSLFRSIRLRRLFCTLAGKSRFFWSQYILYPTHRYRKTSSLSLLYFPPIVPISAFSGRTPHNSLLVSLQLRYRRLGWTSTGNFRPTFLDTVLIFWDFCSCRPFEDEAPALEPSETRRAFLDRTKPPGPFARNSRHLTGAASIRSRNRKPSQS